MSSSKNGLFKIFGKFKLDNYSFLMLWVLKKYAPFVQSKRTKNAFHCASCGKPQRPELRSVMCSGCVDVVSEELVTVVVKSNL
jgi:hypothetical protein